MKKILCIVMFVSCALIAQTARSSDEAYRQAKADLHRAATGEELVFLPDVVKPIATSSMSRLVASAVVEVSNVRAAQREGTKLVDVYYDLSSASGYKCKVQFAVTRDGSAVTVADGNRTGDIGDWVSPGIDRHIVWNAGGDCQNMRSFDFRVSVTAVENAEQVSSEWATVTIAWYNYGGRDIDICGYWLNNTSKCYGWSYNTGSTNDTSCSVFWRGDNTGRGPEYLLAKTGGDNKVFRVHFNHFGTAGSPARVDVTVAGNGVTKSITSKANTRGGRAITSDPYVTIFFDESGTPTNITRSVEL